MYMKFPEFKLKRKENLKSLNFVNYNDLNNSKSQVKIEDIVDQRLKYNKMF